MPALKTLIVLFIVLMICPAPASARDLMSIIGVNSSIDNAAEKMQALIDQARQAAFALEFQANADAKDRIDQINKTIESAINDIQAVESKTQADIDAMLAKYLVAFKALVDDTFAKLKETIDSAECAVDKSLNQHLQDMLGKFGQLIDANTFEIVAPPMYAGEQECGITGCSDVKKTFKINSADFAVTYKAVRDYLNSRLQQSRNDTPISSILRSYNIIANTAKRAGCQTGLRAEYDSEAAPYMAAIKIWEQVTDEPGVVVP